MKYYEELKKKYYETFPEELTVKFGCALNAELTGYVHTTDDVRVFDRVACLGDNINVRSEVKVFRAYGGDVIDSLPFNRYSGGILGVDIDIREVLRMKSKKVPNSFSVERLDYKLVGIKYWDKKINESVFVANIDLSLPLKEQEETCEKLLELLK